MSKALGMIETRGLIASIEAADAMVKSADVRLVRQEKVDAALVTILIEGDVSAVQAAVEAGREAANRFGTVVSHLVIPHPDGETKELIKKEKLAVRKGDKSDMKEQKEIKETIDSSTKKDVEVDTMETDETKE